MKYQIVGTNEDNLRIVIDIFDDLKMARESFDCAVMLAQEPNLMPWHVPSIDSIELQQVETISRSEIIEMN
jgi:hypothetical protein